MERRSGSEREREPFSLFSPFQEGVKLVYFCRRFRSDEGSRLDKNKNLHPVIGKMAKWSL